jgi:hypothetical protein
LSCGDRKNGNRVPLGGLLAVMTLLLGACAHQHHSDGTYGSAEAINTYPTDYKSDIVAAMRAYLRDPSGIDNAAISGPVLKPASLSMPERYVACLRFNAKKSATVYAGLKEVAAVFLAGRFDQFIDTPKDEQELCAGATYAPFPELEKLPRY